MTNLTNQSKNNTNIAYEILGKVKLMMLDNTDKELEEDIDSKRRNFAVVTSGPSCSKLMTLLVNISLNFQKLISQIYQYFLLKKCEKLLQCKSFSHFFNKIYQCIWL